MLDIPREHSDRGCMDISDLLPKMIAPTVWADNSIDHKGLNDVKSYILQFGRKDPDSEESLAISQILELMWIHRLRSTTPMGLNVFD